MKTALVIVSMAVVTYALRFGGLWLAKMRFPPFLLRVLYAVPLAVFAALIVSTLAGEHGEGGLRLVAASCAGLAVWRLQRLWVGILVGMGMFWLLRLVSGVG
jgi:branched-subunit amino acid transport protein